MDFSINYLAVLIAAVAGVAINALWYSVIWKAQVARLRAADPTIAGRDPAPPMYGIAMAGQLVMAFVLAIVLSNVPLSGIVGGMIVAALLWLGFTLTALAQVQTFGYRQPGFIVLDAGNWLVSALVMGAIISAFG